jgi:hypothetical protein
VLAIVTPYLVATKSGKKNAGPVEKYGFSVASPLKYCYNQNIVAISKLKEQVKNVARCRPPHFK